MMMRHEWKKVRKQNVQMRIEGKKHNDNRIKRETRKIRASINLRSCCSCGSDVAVAVAVAVPVAVVFHG